MDKLERRMKEDAAAIEAEVSPQLQMRIEASLQGTQALPSAARNTPVGASTAGDSPEHRLGRRATTLWWASSLTGLLTAALVIVLLNWQRDRAQTEPVEVASDYTTVPSPALPFQSHLPLRTRTADLTEPLEQELLDLQADIEKARETLERDLRATF